MSCRCTPDTTSPGSRLVTHINLKKSFLGNDALAACSLVLCHTSSDLMEFAAQSIRQTLSIPVASDCQKPFCGASRPGQPAVRHGFKWPGKKIWLHWNRWQKSLFLQWSQAFTPGSCKASVCTELFSCCQVLLDLGRGGCFSWNYFCSWAKI